MFEVKFFFVRPKFSGNIGSIARVIKNFGFRDLILIAPRTELDDEAYIFAAKAKDVLERIRVYDDLSSALKEEGVNYVVGTTARIAGDKRPLRNAITSNKIRELEIPTGSVIGVLLGGEDSGLTNEELEFSDVVVTIPTASEYPVMNVSHAAAILAYEFSLLLGKGRALPYRPAEQHEKEVLVRFLYELVEEVLWDQPLERREIFKRIVRNWVGRVFLTGREVHTLIGIVKRALRYAKLAKSKGYYIPTKPSVDLEKSSEGDRKSSISDDSIEEIHS